MHGYSHRPRWRSDTVVVSFGIRDHVRTARSAIRSDIADRTAPPARGGVSARHVRDVRSLFRLGRGYARYRHPVRRRRHDGRRRRRRGREEEEYGDDDDDDDGVVLLQRDVPTGGGARTGMEQGGGGDVPRAQIGIPRRRDARVPRQGAMHQVSQFEVRHVVSGVCRGTQVEERIPPPPRRRRWRWRWRWR